MQHFAQTHSLTIVGGRDSPVRMIFIVGKSRQSTCPCYWLRLEEADIGKAISLGESALAGPHTLVIALADAAISDQTLIGKMERELAAIGLQSSPLTAYTGFPHRQTGFSANERLRYLFRHAGLLLWGRRPARPGSAGAHH
jgi:hypothetical protein